MRLRYIGEHPSTLAFGKTFHQYKWVGADGLGDHAKETLAENPQFECQRDDGSVLEPEPAAEPGVLVDPECEA